MVGPANREPRTGYAMTRSRSGIPVRQVGEDVKTTPLYMPTSAPTTSPTMAPPKPARTAALAPAPTNSAPTADTAPRASPPMSEPTDEGGEGRRTANGDQVGVVVAGNGVVAGAGARPEFRVDQNGIAYDRNQAVGESRG